MDLAFVVLLQRLDGGGLPGKREVENVSAFSRA